MRRREWAASLREVQAASRDNVISAQKLLGLGIPSTTIYRQCGTDGPWQRLLPGIVLLHLGKPSRTEQVAAALLYGGESCVVTAAEACRRYGLRHLADDESIHLLVPHDHHRSSSGFVVIERTVRPPKPYRRSGVPLAPVTRAVLDATRRSNDRDAVRALIAESVQRGLTTVENLAVELGQGSQRGSALPRKVLAEVTEGPGSVAEIDANELWARTGLPAPEWNGTLRWPDGQYIARPDAWCGNVGLAWEIDSLSFHLSPDSYAKTLARNSRYAAAGIAFLQTLPSRLRTEPNTVVTELRAAYEAAASRPCPPVIFHPRG